MLNLFIVSNISDGATAAFKPLKKKVSPLIFATASKLVLQRSMGGLKGQKQSQSTHGDSFGAIN